jgi:hypothetical protein
MPADLEKSRDVCVSIAIFAWNEEKAIASAIDSLFRQSIFPQLRARGERCEIICVLNGCTDHSPWVSAECLDLQQRKHPEADFFTTRVANLAERGKINAWNQFVHRLAAREARLLFMLDADIVIHRTDTLWNMFRALEQDPEANVAVDRPCKNIDFKKRKSFRDRISLAASRLTQSAEAQLCAQLYCIRSQVARNIYLPKDLAACEDGFLKMMVCTDSLTHEVWPHRIRLAEQAEHTFEAYTSPAAILRNQKRQIIGQTIVHLLVDQHLRELSDLERRHLAATLRNKEATDPDWLKRLINGHLKKTRFFWRLYPDLLGHRFKCLRRLRFSRQLLCFPAAAAGWCASILSSSMAYRSLKSGCTNYWPKAERAGFQSPDPLAPRVQMSPQR